MLTSGRAALPARGVQALPAALAKHGALHPNTPVMDLVGDEQRVLGVRTSHATIHGSAVVVARDGDATARLTNIGAPRVTLGSTTVCLAGQQQPYRQKLLVLNALPEPLVNDTTLLTNIAPEYAPAGWHLLAAHVLDTADLDDSEIDARVRNDLSRIFPHVNTSAFRTLQVVRTPHSQFAQLPGAGVVATRTSSRGLYVAGEITEDSSVNGALRSGFAAARSVSAELLPTT